MNTKHLILHFSKKKTTKCMNNICFIENIALKQILIKTSIDIYIYSSINLENSSKKSWHRRNNDVQGCTTPSLKRDPLDSTPFNCIEFHASLIILMARYLLPSITLLDRGREPPRQNRSRREPWRDGVAFGIWLITMHLLVTGRDTE